jgi:hypothetical protein
MLCAHTVRQLKPGCFEQFAEAFTPGDMPPPGWVRFTMLRGIADPDQVITFGYFDGTLEELEGTQVDHGYAERVAGVAPLIESTIVNGVYEITRELTKDD